MKFALLLCLPLLAAAQVTPEAGVALILDI